MQEPRHIFDEPAELKHLPEMIFVEGGTFRMGSEDDDKVAEDREKPAHDVTLDSFHIGKYPVTVQEYLQFVEEAQSHYPEWLEEGSNYNINTGNSDHYKSISDAVQNPTHPIVGISWDNATAYCQWLSQKMGETFRLPTEAEWEYAAKGGIYAQGFPFTYSGSNKLNEVGWYEGNSHGETKPVGLKTPNFLGIHDMSGNVCEWCNDEYEANYYKNSPTENPKGGKERSESSHVLRGGTWAINANYCRSSDRLSGGVNIRHDVVGFRLARD